MKGLQIFIIILMLIILLASNVYVIYRIWNLIPPGIMRIISLILTISLSSSFFVAMFANSILLPSIASILYKVGTAWFFIFLYLLITFLFIDLCRVTRLFPIEKYMYSSWIGFIAITVFITTVMTFGFIKYKNKERVELTITIDKHNENTESIKIVAISDLHLGYGIGKKEFEKWIKLINDENPDIVIIGGDIIDNSLRPLFINNMSETFKRIKTKYGVYASLGNHEYISGLSGSLIFLENSDITVLRDSSVMINNSIYIIGRDDRSNINRKSIEELTVNLDNTKPIILIDHQPYNLDEAEKNNIDFQFSGHTHHGQLLPISWITNLIFEKSHGYLKKGNSNFYISSGIGIWGGKFRIGTQSEYVVINLVLKNKNE